MAATAETYGEMMATMIDQLVSDSPYKEPVRCWRCDRGIESLKIVEVGA